MRRSWPIHLLVLLGYIVLSVIATWPLALHFTTALPGEGTDSWQYLWNFWWFDQALFHGKALYFTQAQYYPQGTSLLFHTLSPLNSALALPVRLLGGYVAAYNFIVLLATVLSGYGTFLLVLEVLSGEGGHDTSRQKEAVTFQRSNVLTFQRDSLYLGAFLAGAVFALASYRSVHLLGHLSLVSTETLPFFALFAWQSIRRPGWKPALGVALSWAAAALIDWYYPLYMVLLAGFLLLWALGETLLRRRSWDEWVRAALTVGAGLLVAASLLAPLLAAMLRQAGQAAYLEEPLSFSTAYGADLAAFFLPSPLHPLWGSIFRHWTDAFAEGNTAEGIVYLGLVALVLAGVGLWRARRPAKVWAVLAGAFGLLALGPYLKVLNQRTAVPLPYLLLNQLPIIQFTRVPSRYAVLVDLATAVLAGLGVAAVLGGGSAPAPRREGRQPPRAPVHRTGLDPGALVRARSTWLRPMAAGLLLTLVTLDYLPIPYPLTPAVVSPFYRQLANDPAQFALLEVPLQKPRSPWYYTHWMLEQTVHGKDSFRGYISRGDPLFPFEGAPLFRQFARLGPATDITYDDWHPLARSVLSYYRVGYVLLEKARLEEPRQFQAAQALVAEVLGPSEPAYEDDELVAYRVEWGAIEPFLRLGQGWHEVEEQAWGTFRWIQQDRAELYIVLPGESNPTLSFQAISFLRPRRLEVVQDGTVVATLEVGVELGPYQVPLHLPAGETRLELRADGYDVPAAVGAGTDPRPLSIGFSEVRIR
jgi:hypothetical protein